MQKTFRNINNKRNLLPPSDYSSTMRTRKNVNCTAANMMSATKIGKKCKASGTDTNTGYLQKHRYTTHTQQ